MSNDCRPADSWDRLAAELRAGREAQRKAWGDTDNLLLGRYLADDLAPEERRQVEQALKDHPDLQLLTEVVREVMTDCPVESEPAIIPFSKSAAKPRSVGRGRVRIFLAAACALLVVGLPLGGYLSLLPPPHEPGGPVALSQNVQPVAFPTAPPKGPASFLRSGNPEPAPVALPLPSPPASDPLGAAGADKQREAKRLLEKGKRDLANRQYERARDAFGKAASLVEAEGDAHFLEGVVSLQAEVSRREDAARKQVARENYVLAMKAADKALEAHQYDKAADQFRMALRFQPSDRAAHDALTRTQRLAARVTTKIAPAVTEVKTANESLNKATAALRTFSPAAGHVAEALCKWAERWQSNGSK